MKIKKVLISSIIVFSCLLTGCWDQKELNYVFIVSGIGIDKVKEGGIRVSILSSSPKVTKGVGNYSSGNSSEQFIVLAEEGESIVDACNKISRKLSREIIFSQLDGIIIGEDMAREGLIDILDFFPRMPQVPMKAFITFTEGEARDALNLPSHLEYTTLKKIDKARELNITSKMYIKDFIYMMTEKGIHPCSAYIGPYDVKNSEDELNGMKTIGFKGGAIFKDDKLIGFIDKGTFKGVLIIKNSIKNIDISVNIPRENGFGKISGNVTKIKTKVIPRVEKDNMVIDINILMNANIIESNTKLDFSKSETIHYVEELYSNEVNKMIEDTIKKIKNNYGLDVFGFGTKIFGKYPKLWREKYEDTWGNDWNKYEIKVSSVVKIKGTGFDQKSITNKKQ